MNYITLKQYTPGIYITESFSGDEMCYLGSLFSDFGYQDDSLDEWILGDNQGFEVSGNSTYLEKKGNYIYISDLYELNEDVNDSNIAANQLKISRSNLAKLFLDWKEKVCKKKPKEVTITYDNDQYVLTTSD